MTKPYTFQPVYAVTEAVDLGQRLVNGARGLAEIKDASGILGCAMEKHDDDPNVQLAVAAIDGSLSLQQLGERLMQAEAVENEQEKSFLFMGLLMRILQLLLGSNLGF